MIDEEAAVVEARQGVGDRVDAQHGQIRLRDEARLLQHSLLAVQVVQENRLKAERRPDLLPQSFDEALDLAPSLQRFSASNGIPVQSVSSCRRTSPRLPLCATAWRFFWKRING